MPLRKRDWVYIGFFVIHVPIIFLIDTTPLLPTWLVSNLSHQLREYHVATYRDKFFEDPVPAWFTAYTWMDLLYHVPASIWAVWGLLRRKYIIIGNISTSEKLNWTTMIDQTCTEHPLLPVHLLIFGVQSFLTTLTCLVEVWSWPDRSVAEKQNLTSLYAPYMALGIQQPKPCSVVYISSNRAQ